jgi:SAM-dependent methyltransferase
MNSSWCDEDIYFYYLGITDSEYPKKIWDRIKNENAKFKKVLDIGSGPGAFALAALNDGYDVQAVDVNEKHLNALKKKNIHSDRLKTVNADWLDAVVEKSDISICAYCLSNNIKSSKGIAKIIETTKYSAYFVSFVNTEKTDFLTSDLIKEFGIKPRKYTEGNNDIMELFSNVCGSVAFETVTYDFGVPIIDTVPIDKYAGFISRKTGISDLSLIKKHIKEITINKNNCLWLPNPKESILITWRRNSEPFIA